MAKPSGQNTMKPTTISAMVAGVHAGRISAEVFMFSRSFRSRQPDRLLEIEMGRQKRRFKATPAKT
jgi:hypothetical protein